MHFSISKVIKIEHKNQNFYYINDQNASVLGIAIFHMLLRMAIVHDQGSRKWVLAGSEKLDLVKKTGISTHIFQWKHSQYWQKKILCWLCLSLCSDYSQSVNKGVCTTAPATPGLLIRRKLGLSISLDSLFNFFCIILFLFSCSGVVF